MALMDAFVGDVGICAPFFVQDTRKTTGMGLGALVYNSPGLQAAYRRESAGSWVPIVLVAMTLPTWVSGGFVQDDASLALGNYTVGVPNAALVIGARWVEIRLEGAENMSPVPVLIILRLGIAAAVVVRG